MADELSRIASVADLDEHVRRVGLVEAYRCCLATMADHTAPAAARVQAARTVAQMAGVLAPRDLASRTDAELTVEDIDAELQRLAGGDDDIFG